MPQEIVCSGCGYVLFKGEILKSPQDIVRKYEGKCPKCSKTLNFDGKKVEIIAFYGVEGKKS